MRAGKKMDHRRRSRQHHQHDGHKYVGATTDQQPESPPEYRRNHERRNKNNSIEPRDSFQPSDAQVVEPLPPKPRFPAHAGGKGIHTRNRMSRENFLPCADVPANARIPEQPVVAR